MRIAAYLLCLWIILTLGCSAPKEGRDSLEREFAKRYRDAHASGEVDNMMALFWWKGVSDGETRFFVKQALVQEIDYPIKAIYFEDLGPDGGFDYEFQGERYHPNLKPYSRFVIEFAIEERLTSSFILGKHEERLFFVNAAPVETHLTE
ncbi:hypothetical protein [Rubellicoccus peritrichatus]|uniref:Lipoprotein n=1 Tax=Rubellicoccus peritrichatus TaxID=3080537 RepID=A0AAQ3QWI2_9BACT|nr:hypothetical protein [Puniceicoccus sp. CR14]WOO41895.1 hypothetical protein RZN69_02260 [Puniceicoccus sp. CR14]